MPVVTPDTRALLSGLALLLLAAPVRGASDAELLAELAGEAGIDLGLPAWDLSGSLSLAAGVRDNVTLAALAPDSSGLLRAHADVLAWRLPADGWEWLNFADLTTTRYLSVEDPDSGLATLALVRSEVTRTPRPGLGLILGAQYVFQDEAIDASTIDSGLGTVLAKLHSLSLEPRLRLALGDRWELRLDTAVKFDDYRAPLDDYRETEVGLGLTRDLGRPGSLSLSFGRLVRDFETRARSTTGGRAIPGTRLATDQDRIEARHEIRGGEGWKWSAKSRLAFQQVRDNGEGWYDFDRWHASLGASLARGPWTFEADLAWRRYAYGVQTAGLGEFESLKHRDSWNGALRIERELGAALTLFAAFEFEESDSNDPFLVYGDRLAFAGVRWSR